VVIIKAAGGDRKSNLPRVVNSIGGRTGEEVRKEPKATTAGPGRGKKQFTPQGKLFSGRGALGIPGTSRARLLKLATIPIPTLAVP
jgi:hypothetical protein